MASTVAGRYRLLIREAARFCVVGAAGVVVTDGGTNLLRESAGLGWLTANVIATLVAIEVRTSVRRETLLFFALAGVGLAIQLGCLGFTVHVLGESGRLAGNVGLLTGIMLATVFRFWAYRKWVWRAVDINERDSIPGQGVPDQRGREPDRAGGGKPVRG
jgi:putative flippase GtrA